MRDSSDERSLLDECTGRGGCPAELHLVGCPARRKPAHPPANASNRPQRFDPDDKFYRETYEASKAPRDPGDYRLPLPDPSNLEWRGATWLGRVSLLWLGLFFGALLPVGVWPITICGLGIVALVLGLAWDRRWHR